MSEMIETAAREIAGETELGMAAATVAAEVAIRAMREPTPQMVSAGDAASPEGFGTIATERQIGAARVSQIWAAMIDAALAPDPR